MLYLDLYAPLSVSSFCVSLSLSHSEIDIECIDSLLNVKVEYSTTLKDVHSYATDICSLYMLYMYVVSGHSQLPQISARCVLIFTSLSVFLSVS